MRSGWIIFAAGFALCACNSDANLSAPGGRNLVIVPTGRAVSTAADTRIYAFVGAGASRGEFSHRILRIGDTGGTLSAALPVGTWDLALVSCDDVQVMDKLVAPLTGVGRAQCRMYELAPQGGTLPSAPELYTARVDAQRIEADKSHSASASFARNVAMIKVVVGEVKGMKTDGQHSVYLGDVPTILDWEGGLYPDRNNPATSTAKMRGALAISDVAGGMQRSDTAVFIVPAHRGSDFLSANPADTATHNLSVSVDLALADGSRYVRNDVKLPVVPKANKILVVNLLVRGSLEVRSSVLDWKDEKLSADISHTELSVDKSSVGLSQRDTMTVRTNASSTPRLTSGATWLTARFIDSVRVVLTADSASYTVPRSTWVDVSVNNATKRISVTQRPDKGTITASPARLWMSPSAGNASRTVSLWSTGPWRIASALTKANASPSGGNPYTGSITLARRSNPTDNGNYTMYGDDTLTLCNDRTFETVSVPMSNIYMRSDDVYINNPHGADTTVVSDKIEVFGGSRRFTVTSKPSWITSATCDPNGRLKLTALRDPVDNGRDGMMTIVNADDTSYTIKVKITQDFNVLIPAFNYFVLKYTWVKGDADVAFRFTGNGAPFDDKPVGYDMGSVNGVMHDNKLLCKWGGDARGSDGETVFFNAPVIDGSSGTLPRNITMEAYATWYDLGIAPAGVTLTVSAYLGGTMVQQGTNFVNSGGSLLYKTGKTLRVTTTRGGHNNYASGGYTKMCTIVYDRFKHSAYVIWNAPEWP
ncbi:MAG: hypothetical protein LBH06_01335 [Rikenellaceae bacterium]|jgi:hypothetical protein|nr:hypothetical protein [Rikenellaceae bacterium]